MKGTDKMKTLKLCIILICVLFSPLLFSQQASYLNESDSTISVNSRFPEDSDIARAVKTELLIAPNISPDEINIAVKEGIVTLSGNTSNILTKERAIEIAESVTGVKSVVNNITVSESKRSDGQIENDITVALANNPATEAYDISTTVSKGMVYLTGDVQSWQQKDLCTNVAESIKGVRNVNDDLKINYSVFRSDKDIREDVLSRLKWDVYLDLQSLKVKVNDGNVSLCGTVASAAEKRWAYRDAWVEGTKSVSDKNIKVQWWANSSNEEIKGNEIIRDEDIKTALEKSFSLDPRVLSYKIDTNVNNGIVTLKGTVASLQEKYAADEDAERTTGVSRVIDKLNVKIELPPTDSEISNKVSAALLHHPYFNRHKIDVTADNGKIYLTGVVNNEFEKNIASAVVASIKGVSAVNNDLTYQSPEVEVKSDSEIRKNIVQQLYWNPVTNSRKIKVDVNNGNATLTGYVSTKLEKDVAAIEAYMGGAKIVENEIGVI